MDLPYHTYRRVSGVIAGNLLVSYQMVKEQPA